MSLKQPRFAFKGRPHSQLLAGSRNAAKTTRASRDHFVGPLFSGWLSPVETDMGESSVSGAE